MEQLGHLLCAAVRACSTLTPGAFVHEERELATLQLLQEHPELQEVNFFKSSFLKRKHFQQYISEEALLSSARAARFYQLCEMLLRRKNNFAALIDCWLDDNTRPHLVFTSVRRLLGDNSMEAALRASVEEILVRRLPQLCSVDTDATAHLLCSSVSAENVYKCLNCFVDNDIALLHLLLAIERVRHEHGSNLLFVDNDYRLLDRLFAGLCQHANDCVGNSTGAQHLQRVLRNLPPDIVDARYRNMISMATEYDVLPIRVLLLEHRGLHKDAQMLLMEKLRHAVKECQSSVEENTLDKLSEF